MREELGTTATGLTMGFALSRIGFTSWDEVHGMFTFSDLRLLLTFVVSVLGLSMAWPIITRMSNPKPKWSPRSLHRGTLVGGAIFGAGWAISGACPSIALVQIGEGQMMALWSLVGMFIGNWIYAVVHERYFQWDLGSCIDD